MQLRKLLSCLPHLVPMLTLLLLVPVVNATTYTQALSGGRWNQRTIYVYVDPTPDWSDLTSEGVMPNWAQATVIQAMQIWNHAQLWFVKAFNFNPNGIYNLTITSNLDAANIHVIFLRTGTTCTNFPNTVEPP